MILQKIDYIEHWPLPTECAYPDCDLKPVKGSDLCLVHIPTRDDWREYEDSLAGGWRARRKREEDRGYVYFVLGVGSESVKIGKSKNVKERIASLQTGTPFGIVPLVVIPCERMSMVEGKIHTSLRDHRLKGEWFRLSDEVIDLAQYAEKYGWEELIEEMTTTAGRIRRWKIKLGEAADG